MSHQIKYKDAVLSCTVCVRRVRCSFHVGGFASGLQCTSAALPVDIALLQPYLGFALPVVVLTMLVIVWEVSGENVCDP